MYVDGTGSGRMGGKNAYAMGWDWIYINNRWVDGMGWDEMDPISDDVRWILYLGGRRWSRGCTLWIILL